MKKNPLLSLAALGFLSAIVNIEAAPNNAIKRTDNNYNDTDDDRMNSMDQDEQACPAPLQERKLFAQINLESRKLYNSLDCKGKKLAIQLAEQKCKGQNECKGLNACSSDHNGCPGEGACKGTASGPFKDKNVAVQVAAKYMAKKRAEMYYNDSNNEQNQHKFNNRYGY